jgi:acyl dehydratase
MAVKEGWRGRHYEDFEVGDIYEHPLGRTVLSVDNSWFTLLTQNTNPIHFDHHYAAQTEFGKPLVDSTFTLALVTGQSVIDLTQNAMANLGWEEVRLPNPLFEGDTVYSRSEVLSKRESKSRPNVGIVEVKTTGYKQDGVTVIEFRRRFLVYKRGFAPERPRRA